MAPKAPDSRNHKSRNGKRFARCILHIGTEKTGTKSIQEYLRGNQKALLKQGVLYPDQITSNHASQWEFVAAVHDKPWTQDVGRNLDIADEYDQMRFRASFSEKLEKCFAQASSAHSLLISCEHFQSRLSSRTLVERLRDFLAPWVEEFIIVVYFRRQDRLAMSFLSTRLKSAVRLRQPSLKNAIKTTPKYYDYWALYETWASVFGSGAIRARLYEPTTWRERSLISDFCDTCELHRLGNTEPVLNQSLSRKGFQFLRVLNNRFPITPGDHSDMRRRALVEAVSKTYAGKFYPIGRSDAKAFYEEHKNGNEKLREAAFPTRPSPLFNEDFSDYPEEAEDVRPKYFEAVEVAMMAWNVQQEESRKRSQIGSKLRALLKSNRKPK